MKPAILLLSMLLVSVQAQESDEFDEPQRGGKDPDFTGTQTVFVALLNFPDKVSQFTRQQAVDNVNKMCAFYLSSSYGATTVVAGISKRFYMMPHPTSYYGNFKNRDVLGKEALDLLRNDYGDIYNDYNNVVYCFPQIPKWGYNGYYSNRQIWINGAIGTWLLAHEMGHAQWLAHAHRWQPCDQTNAVDSCGHVIDYGDCFDMMSAQGPLNDFSPYEKKLMRWMPDAKIKQITASGIYRVYRFDDERALSSPVLALSFPQPGAQQTYYVAYRYNDNRTRNGAYVMWADNWSPKLLDYNPATTCGKDAILPIGGTLKDQGLEIAPVRVGGTVPDTWLDVKITLPENQSPTPSEAPPS